MRPIRSDKQVVTRRDEICGRCGSVNQFKQTCGQRIIGTVRVAYARCMKCGRLAQVRFVGQETNSP